MAAGSLTTIAAGLVRITAGQRWLIPVLVALALLAFLFEGAGIYLLVPLLDTLLKDGAAVADPANPVLAFLDGVLRRIAPGAGVAALVTAILVCILLKAATALISQVAFAFANAKIGYDLRRDSFDRVLGARQHYHDLRQPGALLNTLATETWRLSEGMQALAALITHGCAVAVFLVLMLVLSWKLTLITAAGMAVILGVVYLLTARARVLGDRAVAANQRLAARIAEGLAGLRTIRLFGGEAREAARFTRAAADVRRAFFRMDLLSALPTPLLEALFAGLLGVLILAMQGGDAVPLIVFLALLQRLQPHAGALMQARVTLLTLGGALDNVLGVVDDPAAVPLADGTRPAPAPRDALGFDRVRYTYPGAGAAALEEASFSVPAGKTTAVVGASGAGKSTVLALVCRLSDPDAGVVSVDGVDLRGLDLDSWRARCAVVPQDVHLFDASLRENIAYGAFGAEDAAIEAAARNANAHEFIAALPEGYATRVGERGLRLSGGQRQRVALARALVRRPDLLILDEATNALDAVSERLVRDAVAQSAAAATVLVVAHRWTSIGHADHVVVLERGRVVEEGAPAVLRATGGPFSRLFELQRESA